MTAEPPKVAEEVDQSICPRLPYPSQEQLPRTSLCGCRVLKKGEPIPDTESVIDSFGYRNPSFRALFDASKRPVIGETSPVVDYKQFDPLRLCDPIREDYGRLSID